jgi:signal transduction histidine kinase
MQRTTDAKIELQVDELAASRLTSEQAVHVLNICREGISNSVRHSGGNQVNVRIVQDGNDVILELEDDGSGFSLEHCAQGQGLKNIEGRVAEMSGRFEGQSLEARQSVAGFHFG